MLALIYKDYLLTRKYLLITLGLIVVIGYYLMKGDGIGLWLMPALSLVYTFICISWSISYDDKDNFSLFALSGPIEAGDYVRSKFAPAWIYAVVSALITMLLGIFIFKTKMGEMIFIALLTAIMPLFISAFLLPPMLYLGVEKGRVYFIVLYISLFLVRSIFGKALPPLMEKIMMMRTYPWGPGLALFGTFLLIHIIAVKASVRLVQKKAY